MIKPIRPIFLGIIILAMLVAANFALPDEITLSKSSSISVIQMSSVFLKPEDKSKDISEVIEVAKELDEISVAAPSPDTASTTVDSVHIAKLEEILDTKYRIQFPTDEGIALDNFFEALQTKSQTSTVRVMHYGDSQIEGDRITSHLRTKMQDQFGGCGAGLIPLFEANNARTTLREEGSDNWNKYLIYGPKHDKTLPNNYSVLGSYFSYTPVKDSSDLFPSLDTAFVSSTDSLDTIRATLTYKRPFKRYAKRADFERLRLYYGAVPAESKATIKWNKDTLGEIPFVKTTDGFNIWETSISGRFNEMELAFEGGISPQLYGMSLDCEAGIAVDNIGLRGSSGTEFTRIDKPFYREQIKQLGANLVIFQFGVNVVPGEYNDDEDFYFAQKWWTAQLKRIKSLAPDLNILVVSVSDMSKKEGEQYISFPTVKKIRDAQRKAAFNSGCAFYDLYEAMGGENSMVSWVNADPPLAGKDYTHFNLKGARMVADMLYNALILEYDSFVKRKQ